MADVDVIIDNAMSLGNAYSQSAGLLSGDAYNAAQQNNLLWTQYSLTDFASIVTGVQNSEIPVDVPTHLNPTEVITQYDSIKDELITLATNTIASYLASYIIDDPAYTALLAIIAENGSIENIATPQWNQAAVRAATDNYNTQANIISMTASRGMPLPPGAQNALLVRVGLDYNTKLQEINLAATVENIRLQVQHLEWAIKTALDFKVAALQAAADYIRALLLGPEIASRMAIQISDLQSNLINAVANLYRARLERDKLFIEQTTAVNDIRLKWKGLEVQNIEDKVKEKVNAAIGSISPMAHIAAGALSQVNALASKATTF